ncbi:hypothetical protein ACFQ7B_33255 [Streptomyces erythrochromogenes]|uniref:hypothetical protein n=1 Tax=Streptomyces erythrochromogenes TaxID=285574 RepID=UPI0036A2A8A5
MSPDLHVIVHPPDPEGGRRIEADGQTPGRALNPGDLLNILRQAGLDPEHPRLDDTLLITWRGGGPTTRPPNTHTI